MHDDANFIAQFFASPEWQEARDKEAFKHKRGLFKVLVRYLRRFAKVPEEDQAPLEIVLRAGRMESAIRSKWGKKAAKTKKRNKALRKRLLARKIERAEARRRAKRRPLLPLDLPVHQKPPRNVA
ncbi:hypothetical protein A2763_02550 [Candidatus Kaiserbacteria bacterium RIFCSPHIGHO2_01_FULL_54_36]|uniref:Uncharacterized protein n=1 Tax=Candidatus Kaiserbacteria bacterium RIFCSPHIGHO2_01_FULL_54_36 TaxID=1798482 RepID=A0A1F6CP52_9BACT|nr:MAG: hypothetical protein A2763_02550 [Candidatus Kaiserbacteria bacterium RIFCSPHIGHO2_01_FULL_54_36]OGG75511.1 MAG: hypothetical protein A3A41_00400 [Candidatus Kaiserbacteria bacterium RIFCSPLOWO2_01_FULL_54_22]